MRIRFFEITKKDGEHYICDPAQLTWNSDAEGCWETHYGKDACANGWTAAITARRKDGREMLFLATSKEGSDGMHQLSVLMDLTTGWYREAFDGEIRRMGHVVRKGKEVTGRIGVSDGPVWNRYWFFRQTGFASGV